MDKEDVAHVYTMEYYSAIKRNEIESFVESWMDLETVKQSEVRKRKTTNAGEGVEKREPSYTVGGNEIGRAHV